MRGKKEKENKTDGRECGRKGVGLAGLGWAGLRAGGFCGIPPEGERKGRLQGYYPPSRQVVYIVWRKGTDRAPPRPVIGWEVAERAVSCECGLQ